MSWFFVDGVGDEQGPLSTSDMASRLDDGSISAQTLCRSADGPALSFKPLTHFKDLRTIVLQAQQTELQKQQQQGQQQGQQQRQQRGGEPGADMDADDGHAGASVEHVVHGQDEWVMDEAEWLYIDDDGAVQGPFGTEDMRAWIEDGHLELTRRVAVCGTDGNDAFRPLSEWAELSLCAASPDAPASTGAVTTEASPEVATASAAEEDTGSASADQWYYKDDQGVEQGPFTRAKLLGWLQRGLLDGKRLARCGGAADWQPLLSFESLRVGNTVAATVAPTTSINEDVSSLWVYSDDMAKLRGHSPQRSSSVAEGRTPRPHAAGQASRGVAGRGRGRHSCCDARISAYLPGSSLCARIGSRERGSLVATASSSAPPLCILFWRLCALAASWGWVAGRRVVLCGR